MYIILEALLYYPMDKTTSNPRDPFSLSGVDVTASNDGGITVGVAYVSLKFVIRIVTRQISYTNPIKITIGKITIHIKNNTYFMSSFLAITQTIATTPLPPSQSPSPSARIDFSHVTLSAPESPRFFFVISSPSRAIPSHRPQRFSPKPCLFRANITASPCVRFLA